MDKTRIGQVTPLYYSHIGGVETHVRMISERLVERGFSVEVLCTDPKGTLPDEEVINGVMVRRFRSWAPSSAFYFSPGLDHFLKEHSRSYDLIHAHNYGSLTTFSAARHKDENKFFFTPHYHGRGHTPFRSMLLKPYKFVGKRILEKADKIISVSKYARSLLLSDFIIDEDKIEFIPNGIDLKEFSGLKRSSRDGRMILSVARLEKYKGMQHLIRVLSFLENDVSLQIVGKGPYHGELEKLIRNMGLEDRVKISGGLARSELLQMYADSDLFALLSTVEAYGLCVAEALASGTPCILADESGLSEWIDGQNCFGVKVPPNYLELSHLIKEVMGNRVTKVSLMDWDEVAGRLIRSYDELASR